MMAQAILESDSGNSALAQKPNFNLFGILLFDLFDVHLWQSF
jgi:uncharacterized FlgJ-related protein